MVAKKKVLRTIKPTRLRGTLKTKDIEKAVDLVRRQRVKLESQNVARA